MSRLFALLVNPRDGELFEAVVDEYARVDVYALKSKTTGRGFLSDDSLAEEVVETNFMRADTSSGASRQGSGVGTVLYTGLCALAAWNVAAKTFRFPVTGAGVCSYDVARSPSAERWWNRMLAFGITRRTTGGVDTYAFADAVKAHLVVAFVAPTARPARLADAKLSDLRLVDAEALAASDFARVPNKPTAALLLRLADGGGVSMATLERLAAEYKASRPVRKTARKNPTNGVVARLRTRLGWDRFR